MIRRRKFLIFFDLFKNKRLIQFNVITDSIYFMENLYKYSMTRRVFLKKRKHFFINYKVQLCLKFFGASYAHAKKQIRKIILNLSSIIVINNFFFFSKSFIYNNKNVLLLKSTIIKQKDKKNTIKVKILICFQFIKLLTLQKQITTLLLIDYVFRKKNKLQQWYPPFLQIN